MHITQIAAHALKGRSFTKTLAPLTLICGPNGSGKSAITDACRIVLAGNLPELGKRNCDTFSPCSGNRLEVEAELSDGRKIWRKIIQAGDSYSAESSGNQPATNDLLDAGAYFAMSASKGIDHVFAAVQLPPEYTVAGIMAQLERVSLGEQHTEAIETAKSATIDACRKAFRESADLQTAISTLTGDTLKVRHAAARKWANDTIGTVRVLTDLKLREGECSAETLTDLRNQQSRIQGLLDEANREAGALSERQQAAARVEKRRGELLDLVRLPEPRFEPVQWPVWNRSDIEAEMKEVIREKELIPLYDLQLKINADDAFQEWNKARYAIQVITKELNGFVSELSEVNAMLECPHCGGNANGWKDKITAKLITQRDERAAALIAATELEILSKEAFFTARNTNDAAEQQRKSGAALLTRRRDLERLISDYEHEERSAEIKQQLQQQAQEQHTARRQQYAEELARLGAVQPPTESELDAALSKRSVLDQDLAAINARIEAAKRLQQDIQRAQQATAEHLLAQATVAATKAITECLRDIKARMVATAFGTLLERANRMVGDILPYPLGYRAETAEIGMYGATGFVGTSTFSGTEQALTFIAVAAALSHGSEFRLVVLDELSRLTESTQNRVLSRFAELVAAGELDQCICILPLDFRAPKVFTEEDREEGIKIMWKNLFSDPTMTMDRAQARVDLIRLMPLSDFQRQQQHAPSIPGWSVITTGGDQ